MEHFKFRYSHARSALILNLGTVLFGAGIALILREVCTNMEIIGWTVFIAGILMMVLSVVWSLVSWRKEDNAAASEETKPYVSPKQ
jgi:hypothetical protein